MQVGADHLVGDRITHQGAGAGKLLLHRIQPGAPNRVAVNF